MPVSNLNGWIPSADRLPETAELVVVAWEMGDSFPVSTGLFDRDIWICDTGSGDERSYTTKPGAQDAPTHWFPLPERPSNDGDQYAAPHMPTNPDDGEVL